MTNPKSDVSKPSYRYLTLAILLLVFFFLASLNLNKPFIGHHDWDNVHISNVARNYLQHGFEASDYLQIRSRPNGLPEELYIYRSKPPGMGFYLTAWVFILGDFEATVRLPFIFLTLISISLFYKFVARLFNLKIAFWATFFFALNTAVIYFSRTGNWEQGSVALTIALLLAYIQWLRHKTRFALVAAYIVAFVALWWMNDMAFLLAILFIYSLIFGKGIERWQTFGLGLAGLVGLATFFYFTSSGFDSDVLNTIQDRFMNKTGAEVDNLITGESESFTVIDFITRFVIRVLYAFSPFMLIFAGRGAYRLAKLQQPPREVYLIWGLLASAIVHVIFWRSSTYVHDYRMVYIFAVPLSILAGYGFVSIWPHKSFVPNTRLQRWAGGGIFGHVLLCVCVVFFLTNLGNWAFLWIADVIQTHSEPDERGAVNFGYTGPHISYYADRSVHFIKYEPDQIQALFDDEYLAVYLLCQESKERAPELPENLSIEVVSPTIEQTPPLTCYIMTPKTPLAE